MRKLVTVTIAVIVLNFSVLRDSHNDAAEVEIN